jgi:hypothetical protein
MEEYFEFNDSSKFTAAAFNKVYLSVFGEKKTAKKCLSDMVLKDDRLKREKNTIRGANILSMREVGLNRRVTELELQVKELTKMLNGMLEEEKDIVEPVYMAEEVNIEDFVEEVVFEGTVVAEVMENMIQTIIMEDAMVDIQAIVAEAVVAEENMNDFLEQAFDEMENEEGDNKLCCDDKLDEWLSESSASFGMIREKINNKELEIQKYGLDSFVGKLWNIFYLVFRNYNECGSIDVYILIGNTALNCDKKKLKSLKESEYEDAVNAITDEAMELLNPDITSKDYKHLMELQSASIEIGMMKAEERLSRRVQNIRHMEEENKTSKEDMKAKQKEARKREEEERKWALFCEKYMIGDKVEICDFNPSPLVRTITGNEVVVKFGDNNTYSYDGKKYKKVGGLYLEVDEKGSTSKAEYYLKRDFNKITVHTYQADISLDVTNDWAIAQDRKNFISYDIIDWLDYYTYGEMYDFTKHEYWLNKKKWDLEDLTGEN